jgi:hypothetical protein
MKQKCCNCTFGNTQMRRNSTLCNQNKRGKKTNYNVALRCNKNTFATTWWTTSQYPNATRPFASHGPRNNLVAIVSIATKYGILQHILCVAFGGKSSSGSPKTPVPELKMLKLARQGSLSKPWRRWRQGPTCRMEQVSNWPRSIGEWDGAKMCLGRSA